MEPIDVLRQAPWVLVALTFLVAGGVKGLVGLGLPTVAMAALSTFLAPAQAAALLLLPSLVTNLWQVAGGGAWRATARRLATMQAGVVVGTLAGPFSLSGADSRWAAAGLGLSLIVYAALGLMSVRMRVRPRHERWLSPLVGAATGAIAAGTGVFVVPAVPYLQALGLAKDQLVQALGLSFTVSTVALALRLHNDGALNAELGLASLFGLVAALAGMGLGQMLRSHVSEHRFKQCFFAALLALGGHIVWQQAA